MNYSICTLLRKSHGHLNQYLRVGWGQTSHPFLMRRDYSRGRTLWSQLDVSELSMEPEERGEKEQHPTIFAPEGSHNQNIQKNNGTAIQENK